MMWLKGGVVVVFYLFFLELESFAKMSSQNPFRITIFSLLSHVNRLCFNSPLPKKRKNETALHSQLGHGKKNLRTPHNWEVQSPFEPQMNPVFFHCSVGFPAEIARLRAAPRRRGFFRPGASGFETSTEAGGPLRGRKPEVSLTIFEEVRPSELIFSTV